MSKSAEHGRTGDHFPLITIGVTCFNAVNTISRALDSALSQDWPNFEVLVVDDSSTDGSREVINEIIAKETRVHFIEHTCNLGCASARNKLVELAKGEFIAFFDDDDVSSSQRLRIQYNKIVKYEKFAGTELIACYASGKRTYSNGYVLPLRAVGADGSSPIGSAMADYLLFNKRDRKLFYGAGTPTCSLMARTSLFPKVGGFDRSMRRQEDVDFAIRLSLMGGHFIGTSECLVTQHATDGNEKSARIEFESFMQILEKNAEYLRLKKSYRYMRMWAEMRYYHFNKQDGYAFLLLAKLLFSFPIRTARHFLFSATRRFIHERRMSARFDD